MRDDVDPQQDDVDPEQLQAELDQIKDAMGLQERYPSEFQLWPVAGGLVLLAALGSQVIELEGLPGLLHPVVWFGVFGVASLYRSWTTDDTRETPETRPRTSVQFAAVFAMYPVVVLSVGPALADDASGSIVVFGLTVGLVGVGYLVTGEALRSYYIRRRDRWAFYVGGAWMLLLAPLLPNVGVLETWGYSVFGVLFAIHAGASYLALSD